MSGPTRTLHSAARHASPNCTQSSNSRSIRLDHFARTFCVKWLLFGNEVVKTIQSGKQTPIKGHPVFIVQHATAKCCRGCILKWHGIEKGRRLNEPEVDFVVALIIGWIELQLDEGSVGLGG